MCCSSYLPRFICCLLRFLFLGYAPSFLVLFPFVRRLFLSSALIAWCMFWILFPNFLVRSLRPRLLSFFDSVFLFCTLESLQFLCPVSFFVTVQPFPVLIFHTSSSASSGFTVLSLLLYSPVLLSSSCWVIPLFWGLVSVRWLAAAPTVSVVTPPLFRPLGLLCPLLRLLLSSLLFRIPHSWLLLLVFLFVFPRADAPVTPSRLPPSMSLQPRTLLEVSFSPASVALQPVYSSSFSVSLLLSVVVLTRSNLRFPLGRVRFLLRHLLSLLSGWLLVVFSISK